MVCLGDRVGFLRSGLWKERPNASLQPQSPRWPEEGWGASLGKREEEVLRTQFGVS